MYGGGYNDLVFFEKEQFSYRRTRKVNTVSHYASFLYLNGRFKTTFAAVFARFWRSKVFPKPHLACFQPSGELPRLPWRIFNPQKCSRSLARRVFNLREYSRSLAWRVFNPQKCSQSLTWRVFNLREYSRGFPGVFSAFKSAPEASLDAFSTFGRPPEAFVAVLRTAYRVFFENSRAIFVARRYLATKALSIRFKQKSS